MFQGYLMNIKCKIKRLTDQAAQISSYFNPADISIYYRFKPPPYGGGNQFLLALTGAFHRQNYRIEHRSVSSQTRACLFNSHHFDPQVLQRLKHPACKMIHRIDGPIDLIRQNDQMLDHWIAQQNHSLADASIFQSTYSYEQHVAMGLAFKNPTVITNAPDPHIFHTAGKRPFDSNRKIRLISSSWSPNMRKGFKVYEWLDQHLDWSKFEYTFVGNSPISFKNIKMLAPTPSAELADILRQHDVYITASELDPCSNALIEALHCGLPALYRQSGGHPEIVGSGGLGFKTANEIPSLLSQLTGQYRQLQEQINVPTLDEVAQQYLTVMGLIT
jgi:glycosyltransferase involved in cell wall biosynthesis